jgi:hypothetical protein
MSTVLTPEVLAEFVSALDFGNYKGAWDIHIGGSVDVLVSETANTLLKEAVIGKHLPTVAEQTQGEVVAFASAAAAKMGSGGQVVLMEGRAPTLNYVRTPFRFELSTRSSPLLFVARAPGPADEPPARRASRLVTARTAPRAHPSLFFDVQD